jgi:urea transporter/Ca2+-binding EF-hand superfamily protein
MPAETPSSFELLQGLVQPPVPRRSRLQCLLPSSGTLPQLNDPARRGHRLLLPWLTGLRSLAQVIFINNPLSGALLLLAFLLESPWMALLAVLGTAGANLSSRAFRLARGLRHQGIHGFNGALVGCAAAVLGDSSSPARAGLWVLLVLLGSAATTLLLEGWSRVFQGRGALPPLTLPFCLVSWGLLALAGALPLGPADPAPLLTSEAMAGPLQALVQGLPRSFGQVFLCSGLGSGVLVLLATALASPLAAALGVLGALVAMAVALLQGATSAAVAQGLWGYNGVLVAIALAGIFHAPTRRSLLLAIGGAACTAPLTAMTMALLPGLPALTIDFVLTTWLLKLVAGRSLPALMPVSVHAVLTPEEHRERYRVARETLSSFRANLRRRSSGPSSRPGSQSQPEPLPEPLRQRAQRLFAQLDRDGDGSLSLAELHHALNTAAPQLASALAAMDRDGDGRVDQAEFSALIGRLQRLREGEERLLLYLMPADADGDDRLDPLELRHLLSSIGETPLTATEETLVFGASGEPISWREFVDRLLLS